MSENELFSTRQVELNWIECITNYFSRCVDAIVTSCKLFGLTFQPTLPLDSCHMSK